MIKKILLILTAVFLLSAVWLTFLGPDRYGYHGDALPCGQNPTSKTFYSSVSYLLLTRANSETTVPIGNCPYEKFSARTYALDLWAITAFLLLTIFRYSSWKRQ